MSEKSRNWPWAVAAVVLFALAFGASRLLHFDLFDGPRSPLVDRPAPSFSLPIVGGEGAVQGDRLQLSALRGRVVLLDFWASWCGPCRDAIPALNAVRARFGDRIDMYGVNIEGDRSASFVANAHRVFGARYPSLHDDRWQAQGAYGVRNIPTLVLIDRQGVVRWVRTGVPDPDDVGDRIENLLATH